MASISDISEESITYLGANSGEHSKYGKGPDFGKIRFHQPMSGTRGLSQETPKVNIGSRITGALKSLKEKDGSGLKEIKKYLHNKYGHIDETQVKIYLGSAIKSGRMTRDAGKYKMVAAKKRKTATKKTGKGASKKKTSKARKSASKKKTSRAGKSTTKMSKQSGTKPHKKPGKKSGKRKAGKK